MYRRHEVLNLYKQLLYMGRDYPKGQEYFKQRLKRAFISNQGLTEKESIDKAIDQGKFVIKELEALYFLKKYRAVKQNYYE